MLEVGHLFLFYVYVAYFWVMIELALNRDPRSWYVFLSGRMDHLLVSLLGSDIRALCSQDPIKIQYCCLGKRSGLELLQPST